MRETLETAFRDAVQGFDLVSRVHDVMTPHPQRMMRVTVIAIGKAAPTMLTGALGRWKDFVDTVLMILPDETPYEPPPKLASKIEILRASHPLPDERSLVAAERALEVGRGTKGLLLALISGGASSLVCAPTESISLEEKRAATKAMLDAGATITEINTVRHHH
jgi:hydroxypyruvate reductase